MAQWIRVHSAAVEDLGLVPSSSWLPIGPAPGRLDAWPLMGISTHRHTQLKLIKYIFYMQMASTKKFILLLLWIKGNTTSPFLRWHYQHYNVDLQRDFNWNRVVPPEGTLAQGMIHTQGQTEGESLRFQLCSEWRATSNVNYLLLEFSI